MQCGHVALVGRPNAGKSTLLNKILGAKLAITSAKPQTTRHKIMGIHTEEDKQFILVDTPGIHEGFSELNKQMVAAAIGVLDDVDVVCWLVDMTELEKNIRQDKPVLEGPISQLVDRLKKVKSPIIVALNKMDCVHPQNALPVIAALHEAVKVQALIPVSALTGLGVEDLLKELGSRLPEGPFLFDKEDWAQVTERFLVEEIVREKIFHLTEQEIPYASVVEVRKFDETERESGNIIRIYADIIVERGTQKGIIIGRRGEMLKRIGTMARKELVEVLGCRVYLELFVKVEKDWTKSLKGLRKVGYGK